MLQRQRVQRARDVECRLTVVHIGIARIKKLKNLLRERDGPLAARAAH